MTYRLRVNGVEIYETEPKQVLAKVFEMFEDLQWWSADALRELYKGVVQEVTEYCRLSRQNATKGTKAKYSRFAVISHRLLKFIPRDRERLLEKIYEHILAGDDLGRLRNYGFGNKFGDSIKGNSEYERISKNRNLQ